MGQIEGAVLLLGIVCVGRLFVQGFWSYQRHKEQGTPLRFPPLMTTEGIGWMLVAGGMSGLLVLGCLLVAHSPWFALVPALALPEGVKMAGLLVGTAGAFLTYRAQEDMGPAWRIGTGAPSGRGRDANESGLESKRPEGESTSHGAHSELVVKGLYIRLRNPIYVGMASQAIGGAMLMPTVLSLAAVGVMMVGMRLVVASEERYLLGEHGESYREYMNRSGRFLPRF